MRIDIQTFQNNVIDDWNVIFWSTVMAFYLLNPSIHVQVNHPIGGRRAAHLVAWTLSQTYSNIKFCGFLSTTTDLITQRSNRYINSSPPSLPLVHAREEEKARALLTISIVTGPHKDARGWRGYGTLSPREMKQDWLNGYCVTRSNSLTSQGVIFIYYIFYTISLYHPVSLL